jgi:hypothetical protein
MSGFSRHAAAAILGHTWGKTEFAKPAEYALAFLTVVPTSSSTGATITEATGATGYVRKVIAAADIEAAAEGETSSIQTAVEEIFAAITAGSATVIGWSTLDSKTTGAGNVVMWGTCTSTVISETQTPPKIAAKALKGELK